MTHSLYFPLVQLFSTEKKKQRHARVMVVNQTLDVRTLATKENDTRRIPRRQRLMMFPTDKRTHDPLNSSDIQKVFLFVRPDQVKILGLENHFTITHNDPFRWLVTRRHVPRAHRKQFFPLNLLRLHHYETPVLVHPTVNSRTSPHLIPFLHCSLACCYLCLALYQWMRAHNTKSLLWSTNHRWLFRSTNITRIRPNTI